VDLFHALPAFGAAVAAGAINSVAGGGTLVSFPTLIWLGLPSTVANATSTVAIWPGSLGGMWGFRRELRTADGSLWILLAPSLAGGIVGALLLRVTPTHVFDRLVPMLILFATLLFMAQEPVQRLFRRSRPNDAGRAEPSGSVDAPSHVTGTAAVIVFQLLVGVYGGYFGAGLGILMLAALGVLGLSDIHQMNGVKNLLTLCINGIASVCFIALGMVWWSDVVLMAIGAIVGGVGGAGAARRIGRPAVRRIVIGIGLAMSASLFLRR
jgi:uncharacterized membrane protein YfcA